MFSTTTLSRRREELFEKFLERFESLSTLARERASSESLALGIKRLEQALYDWQLPDQSQDETVALSRYWRDHETNQESQLRRERSNRIQDDLTMLRNAATPRRGPHNY